MKPIERVLHSLIFEVLAVTLMSLLAVFVTGKDSTTMTGMVFIISLIAMTWNYFYNIFFDKIFGTNRIDRSASIRLLHGLSYEAGMMIFTFPIIMLATGKDLWTVLAYDFGCVVFFIFYVIAYNWGYDVIRQRLKVRKDRKIQTGSSGNAFAFIPSLRILLRRVFGLISSNSAAPPRP